jgi:hypothetical protein
VVAEAMGVTALKSKLVHGVIAELRCGSAEQMCGRSA